MRRHDLPSLLLQVRPNDLHGEVEELPSVISTGASVTSKGGSTGRIDWASTNPQRVRQFLLRVDVLAWDHGVTQAYADLRASCEAKGVPLAPLDMMIAAQAVAVDAVLVSNDKGFARLPDPLRSENWDGIG